MNPIAYQNGNSSNSGVSFDSAINSAILSDNGKISEENMTKNKELAELMSNQEKEAEDLDANIKTAEKALRLKHQNILKEKQANDDEFGSVRIQIDNEEGKQWKTLNNKHISDKAKLNKKHKNERRILLRNRERKIMVLHDIIIIFAIKLLFYYFVGKITRNIQDNSWPHKYHKFRAIGG